MKDEGRAKKPMREEGGGLSSGEGCSISLFLPLFSVFFGRRFFGMMLSLIPGTEDVCLHCLGVSLVQGEGGAGGGGTEGSGGGGTLRSVGRGQRNRLRSLPWSRPT